MVMQSHFVLFRLQWVRDSFSLSEVRRCGTHHGGGDQGAERPLARRRRALDAAGRRLPPRSQRRPDEPPLLRRERAVPCVMDLKWDTIREQSAANQDTVCFQCQFGKYF
jgi:hypothetical protein